MKTILSVQERRFCSRGPYGGCVGYFSFNGNLDICITIRTALLKDGKAYVQAGGGWVNDSEPEAEFQETVTTSKAIQRIPWPRLGFQGHTKLDWPSSVRWATNP